jgi:predicted Zn-dependent protease
MEDFSAAVENMAEGKELQAQRILQGLLDAHPQQAYLKVALAAAELFAGRALAARNILLDLQQSGHRFTGSAYWNLGCAELQLNNPTGALRAFNLCSETEYRTNSAVWQAISALTGEERMPPAPSLPKSAPTTDIKPTALSDLRQYHLRRLIRPRLQQPQYTPDLGGLLRRDFVAIEQILKDARKAAPPAGYSMLVPWMAQHPNLYTLKVHAAAYALAAGLNDEAEKCLEDAEKLRPLDRISRYNLSYICLERSDFRRLAQVLDGARTSSVAERADYWLALAIARSLSGIGDSGDAAARAVLATHASQRAALENALRECRLKPARNVSSDDLTSLKVQEVIVSLDHGDVAKAQSELSNLCGAYFEDVPEIGRRVLQPFFERKIGNRRLKTQSSVGKAFGNGIRSYDDERFSDAGKQFSRLFDEHGDAVFALNAIGAYLMAERYERSRQIAQVALARLGNKVHWKLAYNSALAYYFTGQYRRAVSILEQRVDRGGRTVTAVVVLAAREGMINTPLLRGKAL